MLGPAVQVKGTKERTGTMRYLNYSDYFANDQIRLRTATHPKHSSKMFNSMLLSTLLDFLVYFGASQKA
jgi:hypothetical protein